MRPRLLAAALVFACAVGQAGAQPLALRFFGHGTGDIDRVKIALDAPARPIDVGGAFTFELWLRALSSENGAGGCAPGADNWITGNIVADRDVFGPPDAGDFGLALFEDGLAFGVATSEGAAGICGTIQVDDGAWHHVAATRAVDGTLALWVDGQLAGSGAGPTGDVAYRDGRATDWPDSDPFLVLAAEKHDAGPAYPSFSGWMDEVRLSSVVRYAAPFARPTAPFGSDADTVGLWHLDDGPAGACTGTVADASGAAGGPSDGVCRYGGSGTAGPIFVADAAPLGGGCAPDCPPTSVSGRGLLLVDRDGDASKRKLVVQSRDAALPAPAPGSSADPVVGGAVLRLARGAAETATIVLPASGWKGLGTPPGAAGWRYADKQRTLGPCKSARFQGGRQLKATCLGAGIAFTLDEPAQGALSAGFQTGDGAEACMHFGGVVVRDTPASGGTGQFRAKDAPPPGVCPLP